MLTAQESSKLTLVMTALASEIVAGSSISSMHIKTAGWLALKLNEVVDENEKLTARVTELEKLLNDATQM